MRVNLINSFYTSVFFKKQMLKKLTHCKKKEKEFHVNSAIRTVHMLHCSVNSGGMIHCSMNSVAWLFSKSRAKKQHFSAFKLSAFRTQFIVGPHTQ